MQTDAEREYGRQYYARHRDRIARKHREYHAKNYAAARNRRLQNDYGITLQQWTDLFESQGRVCAICSTDTPGQRGWHTDHCHATDKVRAVLCGPCNKGLGHFNDNPALMHKAAEYLEKHANREGT